MTHGHRSRLCAVPVLLVTLLAGCGPDRSTPRVASIEQGPAGPSASAAPKDDATRVREFAKCMRAAGVDIPDPDAGGVIAVPAQAAGQEGSAESKKMQAAMEKCREFLPSGGEVAKLSPEDIAKMRDLARCMRENGVPDFPDPDPATGALRMEEKPAGGDAAMRRAAEKCKGVGPDMAPGVPAGS